MKKPRCTACGRFETRRLDRRGFFQQVILAKLGFAPWECVFCREPFFRRQRAASSHAIPVPTDVIGAAELRAHSQRHQGLARNR